MNEAQETRLHATSYPRSAHGTAPVARESQRHPRRPNEPSGWGDDGNVEGLVSHTGAWPRRQAAGLGGWYHRGAVIPWFHREEWLVDVSSGKL